MTSAAMIRPLGKRALALLERAKASGDGTVAVSSRSERSAALVLVSHGLLECVGRGSYLIGIRYRLVQP